jgi:diguanylate cyclase (GGDEF)-like protein
LSRYILGISQMKDLDAILLEASRCLKEILDYRLFAFAVQADDRQDVWIDPRIYRKLLRNIIERDFGNTDGTEIHYIHKDYDDFDDMDMVSFKKEDLISFVLMDDKCYAKLYLLPNRKMLRYHTDIIQIITNTLGAALSNYMNIKNLRTAAAFDPLTGCYNRREFDRLVGHNISNAHRHGKDLSLIMFDIDHFKRINDTYGHPTGDEVLKAISREFNARIRKGDYLSRYGGEEFVLVLPDTKMAGALDIAERLRKRVENIRIETTDGIAVQVTASFGISTLRPQSDKDQLIKEADAFLYQAKAGGRNRIMPQQRLYDVKEASSAHPKMANSHDVCVTRKI